MSSSKTTRLEAVNSMLSAAGEAPVANLSDNGGVDSTMAEAILDRKCREIQEEGWHFNTRSMTLVPTGGEILIPDNVISVDPNDLRLNNYGVRGNRLFDLATGLTTGFTANVTVSVIEMLEWSDLPQSARSYILAEASRVFVDDVVVDSARARSVREDVIKARARLHREELRTGNYRIYDHRTSRVVDRGSPLDRITIT